MSRAQLTSTDQQNSGGAVAPFVGAKNLLANGGLDIWQRATTSSSYGGYATADRWYIAGGGSFTTNRDTDVPSGVPVQYSINWTTTASSSFGQFYQAIEQDVVKTLRGQTVTASAWFKTAGTTYAGNLIFRFDYSTSTDALVSVTTNISGTDVQFAGSGATSWVKKTSTFVVPSNAIGLRVSLLPDTVQASGVIAKMTAVQLELGSVATPFSRAAGTLQGELALCQRYYYQETGNTNGIIATSISSATTLCDFLWTYPVTMRTAPSVTSSNGSNHFYVNTAGTGSYNFNTVGSWINVGVAKAQGRLTVSGFTVGQAGFVVFNNTAAYIAASAEL